MQISHRVSITADDQDQKVLASLGIPINVGFATFEVDEAHERWPAIAAWIAVRRATDIVSTRFSKDEIAGAAWLALTSEWHHGYPQPKENDFGYREATYDLSDYCEACGIGMKQKAPFQMKSEPKWGRNGILQLNWIFDEFFVRPEVWRTVFKPYGIGCRAVMSTKNAELQSVVQLVVSNEINIVTEGLSGDKCAKCKRIKFAPVSRGFFPMLACEPSAHAVKTVQWFGSGGRAYHEVLISGELARSLASEKVRGVSLRPVESIISHG